MNDSHTEASLPMNRSVPRSVEFPDWTIALGAMATALCLLPAHPAIAQNDHTNVLSAPQGGGPGFDALGQSAAANLFTGDATLTVPLQVPPGRGQATPALALSYSSSAGDGPFGIGWSMGLGSITRSTKEGTPTCVEDNEFMLSLPGATVELVYDSLNAVYYAELDEAYIEATADETNNEWTVRDRAGRTYRFGTASDARAFRYTDVFMDEASCDFTAMWALNQIEDANGNTIDFVYHPNFWNLPYIAEIRYGANPGAGLVQHPFKVTFRLRSSIRTHPQLSYQLGVFLYHAELIDRIQVLHKPDASSSYQVDRTYTLVYDETHHGLLLQQIQATALPARTFTYVDPEPELVQTNSIASILDSDAFSLSDKSGSDRSTRTAVVDMNGDAIPDAVDATNGNPDSWDVFLGDTTGFQSTAVQWDTSALPLADTLRKTVRAGSFERTEVDTIDITGDGIPDWVDARFTPWIVYPGTCSSASQCGFSSSTISWNAPDADVGVVQIFSEGSVVVRSLMDLNGDGRLDYINIPTSGAGWQVHLGTSSGFETTFSDWGVDGNPLFYLAQPFGPSVPIEPLGVGVSQDYGVGSTNTPYLVTTTRVQDFTGDGLPDLLIVDGSNTYDISANGYLCHWSESCGSRYLTLVLWVLPNTGDQFDLSTGAGSALGSHGFLAWQANIRQATVEPNHGFCNTVSNCYEYVVTELIDVNADGLPDLVEAPGGRYYPSIDNNHRVLINTGGGWLEQGPNAFELDSAYFEMVPRRQIAGLPDGRALRERVVEPNGTTRSIADLLDLNADGRVELARLDSSTANWDALVVAHSLTTLGRVQPTQRLVEADDGARGLTAFQYTPSTQFDNGGADGAPDLPVVRWLTTATRRTDGLCTPAPTTDPFDPSNECLVAGHERLQRYDYADGLFDATAREFRGFGMVWEVDSDGNETETLFSQADFTRGKVLSETVRAVGGGGPSYDLRVTTNDWQAVASSFHPDRTLVYLAETSTEVLSVPSNPVEDMCFLSRNAEPDEYGRVSQSCTYECAAAPGGVCNVPVAGQLLSNTTWADPLPGSYVRERPSLVESSYVRPDLMVALLARKQMRYDGTAGSDPLATGSVTNGNVRWVESWLDQDVTDPAYMAGYLPPQRMEYDAYGNLTQTTNERGHTWTSQFDSNLFALYPVLETGPITGGVTHQTQTVTSLRFGKPTSITDENGQVTELAYDDLGRLICEARPGDSLADCHSGTGTSATREFYYSFADPFAATFEDKHNSVETRIINAEETGYNKVLAYSDALGRARFRKVERTIGAANPTAAPSLVIEGQVDFDSEGRPVAEYVPYVGPAALEDPSAAMVAATLRSYQLNTTPHLDPLDRVHSVDPPDGQLIVWTYSGRTTQSQDQNGARVVTTRDHLGRVVEDAQHDSSGPVLSTSYTLDGAGRVLDHEVSNDPTTRATFVYDTLGRQVSRTDPNAMGSWRIGYDEVGNPIYLDDPKALQHIQNVYDELNRVVRRCTYGTDAFDPTTTTTSCGMGSFESSYVYDDAATNGVGRVRTAADLYGSETFWYDARGRIEKQRRIIQGITAVTSFAYDRADRLWTVTYPDGDTVYHTYNAAGQLIWIEGVINDIDYDFLGRRIRLDRINNLSDTWSYYGSEENFRLKELKTIFPQNSSYNLLDLSYEYNNIGKISHITDHRDAVPSPLSNTADYFYDEINRLEFVVNSSFDDAFAFDSIGNLTAKSGRTLAYGTTGGPHQAGSYGPAIITYDDNGNRQQKNEPGVETESYTYNRFDQLTRIDVGADSVTFGYDHSGRRIWKFRNGADQARYFNRFAWSQDGRNEEEDGVLTKHFWVGGVLVASHHVRGPQFSSFGGRFYIPIEFLTVFWCLVVALLLGAGLQLKPLRPRLPEGAFAARALGAVLLMLAAGPAVLLFPDPAAACGGGGQPSIPYGGWRHYHVDHLGSTQVVTFANGNYSQLIRYDAYGSVRRREWTYGVLNGGTDDVRREFTGYEAEHVSGLNYAGARFYDPELGQFLTHDPADQFPSPYAYGPGDPLNGTDPTGAIWGLIGLAVFIAATTYNAVNAYRAGGQGALFGTLIKSLVIGGLSFGVASGAGAVVGALGIGGGVLGTVAAAGSSSLVQGTLTIAQTGLTISSMVLGDSAPSGIAIASSVLGGLQLGLAFAASSSAAANGVAPLQENDIQLASGDIEGTPVDRLSGAQLKDIGKASHGMFRQIKDLNPQQFAEKFGVEHMLDWQMGEAELLLHKQQMLNDLREITLMASRGAIAANFRAIQNEVGNQILLAPTGFLGNAGRAIRLGYGFAKFSHAGRGFAEATCAIGAGCAVTHTWSY